MSQSKLFFDAPVRAMPKSIKSHSGYFACISGFPLDYMPDVPRCHEDVDFQAHTVIVI
jgi:hypothetical protein